MPPVNHYILMGLFSSDVIVWAILLCTQTQKHCYLDSSWLIVKHFYIDSHLSEV